MAPGQLIDLSATEMRESMIHLISGLSLTYSQEDIDMGVFVEFDVPTGNIVAINAIPLIFGKTAAMLNVDSTYGNRSSIPIGWMTAENWYTMKI